MAASSDSARSVATRAAAEGRIKRFREQTREQRIEIAREAERRFRRKVAWGARLGETIELYHLGQTLRATLSPPCVFDPEGKRLNA